MLVTDLRRSRTRWLTPLFSVKFLLLNSLLPDGQAAEMSEVGV